MAENNDLILMNNGQPFPAPADAKRAITNRGLSGSHTFIKHGAGYALIPKEAAKVELKKAEETAEADNAAFDTDNDIGGEPKGEKYFRVVLPPKAHKDDAKLILGSVNGEQYYFAREVELVVPKRFIDAWNDARTPIYTKELDKGRELQGSVCYCTPTITGPATRAEWLRFRRDSLAERRREQEAVQAQQ